MLHNATFWLLVSMLIFLAVVGKPAKKFIVAALDARRDKIRSELEEAERLRAEAQDLLMSSQRQRCDAVQEAEEIIAAAKAEAERLRQEAAESLKQLIAAREQSALDKIAQAEANATREARELATQLALAASRDLLRQKLTGASGDSLIDAAIAELPQKLAS
jgi:F-type H+-transporting ATPase subunit b